MNNSFNKKKKIAILSLDGGGIRGIITCVILKYIEEQLQKLDHPNAKLGDYFDLIAGTSTGGIIAAVLLYPNQQGTAKYNISNALELYRANGPAIFNTSVWQQIINPFGLLNEKISESALAYYLNNFFGNTQLNQLIKPCAITAYDFQNRCVKIFNSIDGNSPIDNFLVKDICRATTAAPTYFEPAQIVSSYGQVFNLIDGGVYANNPALCAFAEARKMSFSTILQSVQKPDFPDVNDMFFVSVSTGAKNKSYSYKSLQHAGKLKWIKPLIDMLMSANAEAVDYQLKQMFNSLGVVNRRNYFRINPTLKHASAEMDNVSEENINALIQDGLNYIDQHKKTLDQIVKKIIKNKID